MILQLQIILWKKLSKITEGILGDMARRDLHGRTRKEDRITNKDELIERIKKKNIRNKILKQPANWI